jgi:K+-sensing histidine kinase KdpD
MGAMAAGSPSEAANALGRMLDQQNAPTKILMVQDGHHMQQVTDYAIKMASRLDCDIIALDVSDKPLQFSGDRKAREIDRFMELARENGEQFTMQAKSQGIVTEYIVEVGDPQAAITRLSADIVGIRYVLSKPAEEALQKDQERAHIPVFDLHCSRL